MNIACNNCSTKYSLADDQVADGVYQTPCKRCGATMVIRKGIQGHEDHAHAATPTTLRAQRSEDSLLFSLQSLATTAQRLNALGGAERSRSVDAGDSGLLDIRRMAASYHDEQAREATRSGRGRDALPPNLIVAPVPVPVPLLLDPPSGRHARPKGTMWWLIGGATGMAVVAVAVLAVMVWKGGLASRDAQASTSRPAAESADATLLAAAQPDAPAPATIEAPPEPEPAAPEAVTEAPRAPEVEAKPRSSERPRTRTRDREQPKQPETTPPKQGCLDEVACLLASDPPPCCRKYTGAIDKPEPTSKPDPSLPRQLERADIKSSMDRTLPRVTACSARSSASGKVTVSIKVAGNGSVASVTVKESPDSALGACVAKAVESASFPKTREGGSFSYPFLF